MKRFIKTFGALVLVAALLVLVGYWVWQSHGIKADIRKSLLEDGAIVFSRGLMSGKDCRGATDALCNNFANTEVVYLGGIVPCGGDCNATDQKPLAALDSSLTWQIASDEAVLLFGPPPPSDTHFGLQLAMYERPVSALSNASGYIAPAPGEKIPSPSAPGRAVVDASVGGTLNNHTLRRSAHPQQADEEIFALIITANQTVAQRIRAALTDAGVPEAAINVIGLPGGVVLTDETTRGDGDSFRLVGRVARPFDEAAVKRYLRPTNLKLWRVRYGEDVLPASGYPSPRHRDRISGLSERDASVMGELAALKKWVIRKYGDPRRVITASPRHYRDQFCIDSGSYCWGNNNDALYVDITNPGSPILAEFDLSRGSKLIVFGVDHHQLGFSDFWNIAWFDSKTGANLGGINKDFVQSDFQRPPELPGASATFFVEIASICAADSKNCIAPDFPDNSPSTINIINRIYVNPKTGTGPSAKEVILPTIFVYTID